MIRYGIVGTGWITDVFIEGASMVEGLILSAVCSRDKDKADNFAKKHNAPFAFTNYKEMALSDKIDAVYIASPNSCHYEQSKFFLQNGKHVICEKPITVKPEELQELQNLAKDKNLIYIEATKMLYQPHREIIKEALKKIEPITNARFDFSKVSSHYFRLLEGELPNVFNPKFGTGCLMDLGIYCVYPAIDLFGKPKEIINRAGMLPTGTDGFDNAIFIYDDKQVNITCSKVGSSVITSEIMGLYGSIKIGSISRFDDAVLVKEDGTEERLVEIFTGAELMKNEAEAFYRYITDFDNYKEEYFKNSEITLTVNRVLKEMRDQAGISFE